MTRSCAICAPRIHVQNLVVNIFQNGHWNRALMQRLASFSPEKNSRLCFDVVSVFLVLMKTQSIQCSRFSFIVDCAFLKFSSDYRWPAYFSVKESGQPGN